MLINSCYSPQGLLEYEENFRVYEHNNDKKQTLLCIDDKFKRLPFFYTINEKAEDPYLIIKLQDLISSEALYAIIIYDKEVHVKRSPFFLGDPYKDETMEIIESCSKKI